MALLKSINLRETGIFGYDDTNNRWQALGIDSSGNLNVLLSPNSKVKVIDSAGTIQDWVMPEGQEASANSMPMVLSTEQEAILAALLTSTIFTGRIGEVQASPTANTLLGRLKDLLTELQLKADLSETQPVSLASVPSHAVTNAGTFPIQNNYVLPLATNVSSTLTLTSASTAYQITEPGSAFEVTYCNMSDTDMYWGFATLTSGGILLAKNGGTRTFRCAASNSPFFYCASAGKVLNYTTTLI